MAMIEAVNNDIMVIFNGGASSLQYLVMVALNREQSPPMGLPSVF
jgi:hypothetical protein